SALLPRYEEGWRMDFASHRTQEEQGRQLRQHARNELLHVESFPTRPTQGDRILRIFPNINPARPRVWLTTETFEGLAQSFLGPGGAAEALSQRAKSTKSSGGLGRALVRLGRGLGLPVADSLPYDDL